MTDGVGEKSAAAGVGGAGGPLFYTYYAARVDGLLPVGGPVLGGTAFFTLSLFAKSRTCAVTSRALRAIKPRPVRSSACPGTRSVRFNSACPGTRLIGSETCVRRHRFIRIDSWFSFLVSLKLGIK